MSPKRCVAVDPATELKFTGLAEPQCLDQVHDLMGRLWDLEPGISTAERDFFTTAVVELANNIVEHGQGGIGTQFSVTVLVDADQMAATFHDDGMPADIDIDHASLPSDFAESGRGLALARAASDILTYERIGAVNQWQVIRRRASSGFTRRQNETG